MSTWRYIDVHSHLNLEQFADDWEGVLDRTHARETGCITVGVDVPSSRRAIEVASSRPDGVWATVGIHPNRPFGERSVPPREDEWKEYIRHDMDELRKLAAHQKVVAIGECGFDYFRSGEDVWSAQRELFEAQIGIAREVKKPLMLHIRSGSGNNAYADALEVLKKYPDVIGNVHFFAGSYSDACAFFDRGYSVSFTGVITFADSYDETVKKAPLSMLHAETDSPYAAPVPHRGARNEPEYVEEVVKRIAVLRNESLEAVAYKLRENAGTFFGI